MIDEPASFTVESCFHSFCFPIVMAVQGHMQGQTFTNLLYGIGSGDKRSVGYMIFTGVTPTYFKLTPLGMNIISVFISLPPVMATQNYHLNKPNTLQFNSLKLQGSAFVRRPFLHSGLVKGLATLRLVH